MIDDGTGLFTIGEPARCTGVNGIGSQPSYDEEFLWVVAALRAHQGR
ncbi:MULTISPECIES: hypothetical protein [unclassified Streptomyces]